MKKSLSVLAGVVLLAACSLKNEHQTLCASYMGILPAADADGIVTTLTFDNNGRYLERMDYLGKNHHVVNEHGTYKLKNNHLTTVNAAGEKEYYRLEKHQLRRLDMRKKVIEGNLSEAYVLQQTAGCVPFGNALK